MALALLRRWRERHAEALLIVDQFEELFTLNPPRSRPASRSCSAALAVEADVHVLVSMRDDFLVRCHEHPALGRCSPDLTLLGPPTGDALRRALVEPALQCGYRFEDEDLAAEMIDAVAGERGALPLLAFAAARLWEERDRSAGLLTREAYARIGGVAGAPGAARGDHGRADRHGAAAARARAVPQPGDGAGDPGGRATTTSCCRCSASSSAEAETVLRGLIDARLLTSSTRNGRPNDAERPRRRVEIVHESLLAAWPRLVRWQTQDAEGAELRDQLRQAAATLGGARPRLETCSGPAPPTRSSRSGRSATPAG